MAQQIASSAQFSVDDKDYGDTLAINVSRPVYNQYRFDELYGLASLREDPRRSLKARVQRTCRFSREKAKQSILSFFPIVKWLPKYRWKKDFFSDFVAGITVGIMNIPQGMAYGLLTGLPAVYGLYTSLFPPLVYAVFGTSHQISVGTFAVISIMVHTAITTTAKNMVTASATNCSSSIAPLPLFAMPSVADYLQQHANANLTTVSEAIGVEIATVLSMLVGLLMILFGFLHLGFIASYMSDQLVQGLTTGAAIHVFTSQLTFLLGISDMPSTDDVFGLLKYYKTLCFKLQESNVAVITGALICLIILVGFKEFVNDWFKHKAKFPLPMELVVVILATLISYFTKLNEKYKVDVVNYIPSGLPTPKLPRLEIIPHIDIVEVFTIALVTFSISVSMAKIFAKKHDYRVHANQEWFAFGFASFFSSFFSCFSCCASLSRSAVQDGQGGKTQLASVMASSIILVVLLAVAQLFQPLPKFALAAIICVNLKGLFIQIKELKPLWKQSKMDFIIWMMSFLAVLIINVTYGLVIGVGFGLISVIIRSQWPESVLLGRIPNTELYKGMDAYKSAREIPNLRVFRFDAPLYFANAENFRKQLYAVIGIDPYERKRQLEKQAKAAAKRAKEIAKQNGAVEKTGTGNYAVLNDSDIKDVQSTVSSRDFDSSRTGSSADMMTRTAMERGVVNGDTTFGGVNTTQVEDAVSRNDDKFEVHHIVIDCSSFPYVDVSGVNVLKQVYDEYRDIGIQVYFATCKDACSCRFRTQCYLRCLQANDSNWIRTSDYPKQRCLFSSSRALLKICAMFLVSGSLIVIV